jgi:hypothetical protein
MSRADLIEAYLAALPFAPIAVVAIPGGSGCRVAVGGESAPGEKIAHLYYFKPLHTELVLGAAGLADGPIDEEPVPVAARIVQAARAMHAPYESESEIRAVAEQQVAAITTRVKASNASGALKQWNAAYKRYRQAQTEKGEPAMPYSAYLQGRHRNDGAQHRDDGPDGDLAKPHCASSRGGLSILSPWR